MGDISIIMPVIAAIGLVVIIVAFIIVIGIVKKENIKSKDKENFYLFAEEIKKENAEIKKSIQIVKEKVEAIDKMMKDI